VHYLKGLPIVTGNERPGIVHRIDKNTTGLMVIAKTEEAMSHLAKQFFDRTIERRYLALVWGDLKNEEGTIEGNIDRHPNNRRIRCVFPEGERGKHAVTHYKVVQSFGYVTLVECKLETGRTHQIRVHFKHIGHPLFGDKEYGGDKIIKGTVFTKYKQFVHNCFKLMPNQALHAKSLGFEHPSTGEPIYQEAPLPDNFQALLDKWEKYTEGRF
jgi:23S rRNA pseudouridine1911/1915/1917 synthase